MQAQTEAMHIITYTCAYTYLAANTEDETREGFGRAACRKEHARVVTQIHPRIAYVRLCTTTQHALTPIYDAHLPCNYLLFPQPACR